MPASPELDTSARASPAFSRMATASPAESRSAASWLKWMWASKIGIGTPAARAAEGSNAAAVAAAEVARKRRREIMAELLPADMSEPCHSRRLHGKPGGALGTGRTG